MIKHTASESESSLKHPSSPLRLICNLSYAERKQKLLNERKKREKKKPLR